MSRVYIDREEDALYNHPMDTGQVPMGSGETTVPAERMPSLKVRRNMDRFLDQYRRFGTIWRAAKASGMSPDVVTDWKRLFPSFKRDFNECENDITDVIVESAIDQALGEQDAETGRYKDGDPGMKKFLLSANRPQKYRESLKVEGSIELSINVVSYDKKPAAPPPEAIE